MNPEIKKAFDELRLLAEGFNSDGYATQIACLAVIHEEMVKGDQRLCDLDKLVRLKEGRIAEMAERVSNQAAEIQRLELKLLEQASLQPATLSFRQDLAARFIEATLTKEGMWQHEQPIARIILAFELADEVLKRD